MSISKVFITSLLLLPLSMKAQTELEQFEEIAEAMSTKMNQIFLSKDPSLKSVLPAVEWDDEFRSAAECALDKYRSEGGDDFVAQMLKNGKQFVSTEITEFEDIEKALDFMPDGISDQRQIEISQECGLTQLTLKRMEDSGFAEALIKGAASEPAQ